MHTGLRSVGPRVRILAALCVAMASATALAGPLNPPDGPIESTGRPLDRIEPRVCINDLPASPDASHLITSPGHYYLASSVKGLPGQNGIVVDAPGMVIIDLNGFALKGGPGTLDGIRASGGGKVIVRGWDPEKKQDIIQDWGGAAVSAIGLEELSCSGFQVRACGSGVVCGETQHFLCSSLDIEGCPGFAVESTQCPRVIHRDISARSCLAGGIRVGHGGGGAGGMVRVSMSACVVDSCGGDGALIECPEDGFDVDVSGCAFGRCVGHGLSLNAAAAPASGLGAGKVSMSDLSCVGNGGNGIDVGRSPGSPIACSCTHLRCIGNAGDGMYYKVFQPGQPEYGNICFISSSDFSNNGGSGLRSENPIYVEKGTTGSNALYGVRVSGTDPLRLMGHMVGCVSTSNGAACMSCGPGRFAHVDCSISDGLGDGIELTDGCLLLTNTSINRCAGNGITVSGSLNVQGGAIRRSGGYGMLCYSGTCSVRDLMCELNGADAASGTPGGGALFVDCPSVGLERCEFSNNTGDGVKCSSTVGPIKWMAPECLARNNSGNGFDLSDCVGFEMVDCIATGNGGFGIIGRGTVATGRIERCSATGNGGGIALAGTGCLVVSNSCSSGPLGAYSVAQGNTMGPIIDSAGVAQSCNPRANVQY